MRKRHTIFEIHFISSGGRWTTAVLGVIYASLHSKPVVCGILCVIYRKHVVLTTTSFFLSPFSGI
jgi:hypothetical protein